MKPYPQDSLAYMNVDGPRDGRFRISNGTLIYNDKRDARFPYIYEIQTHAQVHSPLIEKILIYVVDTSEEARIRHAKFANTLSVPLGPDYLMEEYGLYIR